MRDRDAVAGGAEEVGAVQAVIESDPAYVGLLQIRGDLQRQGLG